jgi:hypothetical protein
MFTLDMKENQDNVVKLNHINKKTLRGFIQYLHMGSVNNLSEIAMDLFKMADMYDIVGLRVILNRLLFISFFSHNAPRVSARPSAKTISSNYSRWPLCMGVMNSNQMF